MENACSVLRTGSLYGLLAEFSLTDVRLSFTPKIDDIPQLELSFTDVRLSFAPDCKLELEIVSYEGKHIV